MDGRGEQRAFCSSERLLYTSSETTIDASSSLHFASQRAAKFTAAPQAFACRWQERPEHLRESQIVIGCVDTYKGREELEVACRRYLMHYIDIGMDVHGKEPPVIGGQVILSSPGGLCT